MEETNRGLITILFITLWSPKLTIVVILLGGCVAGVQMPTMATAQEVTASDKPTLEQVKNTGSLRSSYRKTNPQAKTDETPVRSSARNRS